MDKLPDGHHPSPSRLSPLGSDASPPEPSQRSGSVKNRPSSTSRTNIRSACTACRRRRSKCSGGNPCDRCRALETECTYNESQDGRTRALRDRGREELEMHKKVVDSIFRAVRDGREQELLSLIRGTVSLEVIATAFGDGDVNVGSGALPTPAGHSKTVDGQVDGESHRSRDARHTDFVGQTPSILQSQPYAVGRHGSNLDGMSSDPTSTMYPPIENLDPNILGFEYMLQPLHHHDTTHLQRLSTLYTSFRDTARQMIATGVPIRSVLGNSTVPCDVLLNSQPITSSMSVWIYALVNSVQGVDTLFRLAWFSYITRFLRWTVQPTKDYYDQMPQAMIPTSLQLQVPHAPVIDLVPIPLMRDGIIEHFRDFVAVLDHAGATVQWDGTINETVEHDQITGNMIVSPRFERHVSNLDNFWFGRNLLDAFPELEGHVQIAGVDKIVLDSQANSPLPSIFEPGPS